MEKFVSFESVRDFSRDVFNAGRLVMAQLIEKADTALADALNGKEDND